MRISKDLNTNMTIAVWETKKAKHIIVEISPTHVVKVKIDKKQEKKNDNS